MSLNFHSEIQRLLIYPSRSVHQLRGGHILTELIQTDPNGRSKPIQTDHLDRFGSVSLVKKLVSVYWIANRHHSVWISSKPIQTDPIQKYYIITLYSKLSNLTNYIYHFMQILTNQK